MKTNVLIMLMLTVFVAVSCGTKTINEEKAENNYPGSITIPEESFPNCEDYVNERLAIFAPFELTSDLSHLTDNERKIIDILWDIADIMEDLFWKQTIGQRDDFLNSIQDPNTKEFAKIMYGPWDRLNDNISFIDQIFAKPKGANFYPVDMTVEEFEKFDNPDKRSGYTLIRRDENGNLKTVWYHEAYKTQLEKASALLREAAVYADDPGFKTYLNARAEALVTSNYQPSDFAWMEMQNANIDFVVGPIENYEDALFGYKCAFESFILVKDPEWSAKLGKYSKMLPELQTKLPVPEAYKSEMPGTDSDINVYDAIYYRGDCNAGSKTIAINLPNDEEVHKTYGSRKLQLKNSMKAKFDKIVIPISEVVLDENQLKHVKFDAFFENVTFHEVGHGMGIKTTLKTQETVREALKEQYSAIEEAKADIMGLFLVYQLYEMGEYPEKDLMDNFVTFFTSIFRSSRFGAASAHGKANMMIFNYFDQHGAFTRNEETGKYTVHFEETKNAMTSLLSLILHLQGDGAYERTKELIAKEGVIKPTLQADLDRINDADIPVDIVFTQGKHLF